MVKRLFVAGSPISQSRSPLIHGHWIAERGLDASYERLDVKPAELPDLLASVRSGTFLGGNLTIPLKQAVMPLLDRVTDAARAMGAVNTIYREDGLLTGTNTDVDGFLAHLDLTCPAWDAKPAAALLLGAGGAARAILHGLRTRNLTQIAIANRSPDAVSELLASRQGGVAPAIPLVCLPWPVETAALAGYGLVINATSLGMKGQPPLDLVWPDRLDGTIAYDIVYAPLITPFLGEARARGGWIVDGLGMLLHQASLAFGHWFGEVPAVSPDLRAMIEADLMPAQHKP